MSIITSLTPAQVAQLSTTAIQSLQTTDIAALSTSQANTAVSRALDQDPPGHDVGNTRHLPG